MIASDQPTIFDKTKVKAIVSSVSDGNTSPHWGPREQTERVIAGLAQQIGTRLAHVVVMSVTTHQDAWDEIADVTSAEGRGVTDPDDRIPADALVTNVPGAALLLTVADCNAVLLHDPIRSVLALAHLGRQSTVAELATKVVQYMQHKYHSSAPDLRIYFSPSIKPESYVLDEFSHAGDPAWKDFVHKTDKGISVDLPGYNRQRFIDAGVLPEHMQVCPVDTATSKDYYSHYRAKRNGESEGRFALLAYLTGK